MDRRTHDVRLFFVKYNTSPEPPRTPTPRDIRSSTVNVSSTIYHKHDASILPPVRAWRRVLRPKECQGHLWDHCDLSPQGKHSFSGMCCNAAPLSALTTLKQSSPSRDPRVRINIDIPPSLTNAELSEGGTVGQPLELQRESSLSLFEGSLSSLDSEDDEDIDLSKVRSQLPSSQCNPESHPMYSPRARV